MPEPKYLSAAEVAALLGKNTQTVRRWINAGKLHSKRFGRVNLIARDDVMAALGLSEWPTEQPEQSTEA